MGATMSQLGAPEDVQDEPPAREPSRAWWALLAIPIAAVLIWAAIRGRPSIRPAQGMDAWGHQILREPPGQAESEPAETELLAEAREPEQIGAAVPLDRVSFARGSSTPEPGSEPQIENVAELLRQYPDTNATIIGFADTTGAPAPDKVLARARADTVREALVAKGVDPLRLRVKAGSGARGSHRTVSIEITSRG
jgi:outer membrane protein OmpA-like peptidoglycan-associated protein